MLKVSGEAQRCATGSLSRHRFQAPDYQLCAVGPAVVYLHNYHNGSQFFMDIMNCTVTSVCKSALVAIVGSSHRRYENKGIAVFQ